MVGLGNVDSTTDAKKPITSATQYALNLKAPKESPTCIGAVDGSTKLMMGLGNAYNAPDANKPTSTATQSALDAKAAKTITYTNTDVDQTISDLIASVGSGFDKRPR